MAKKALKVKILTTHTDRADNSTQYTLTTLEILSSRARDRVDLGKWCFENLREKRKYRPKCHKMAKKALKLLKMKILSCRIVSSSRICR